MNILKNEKLEKIKAMLLAGNTIRKIAKAIPCSRGTVLKYSNVNHRGSCLCGKPGGHNGWCRDRFLKSAARQAIVFKWHSPIRSLISKARIDLLAAYADDVFDVEKTQVPLKVLREFVEKTTE